jgi:hypothetical protein
MCLALCASSCKPSPIAELDKVAAGTVKRAETGTQWQPAAPGTAYFGGNAAYTPHASRAELTIASTARIVMLEDTVIRFKGTARRPELVVELGAITVASGAQSLELGNVKLDPNSAVKISSQGGRSTIELTVGTGRVDASAQVTDLVSGKPVDGSDGAPIAVDAGVRDAPVVVDVPPPPSEPPPTVPTGATVEIIGKRAELLAPGTTLWKPLPQGAGALEPGSEIRVGAGTTAKLVAGGTTVDIATSARVKLAEDRTFALAQGPAVIEAIAPGTVALPGGAVAFSATPTGPAQARIDVGSRDSKITMVRAGSKLTGASGAALAIARGESALLTRTGTIRTLDAIPTYFDLRIEAGESLTIHDPRPPTAVQFQFDAKCPDGGLIEVDRNGQFRTAKISAGHEFANVMIGAGDWAYRLRCTVNGSEAGAAAASGRISARRDDGRRPLPKGPGINDIDADGRNYRISYQSTIPGLVVHLGNSGSANRLHLAAGGKEQTFDSTAPTISVPASQLHEGTYTYWVDRNGVRQDKVSTLTIDFDQTAPQVYIESPVNAQPWSGDIDVRGAVLPGWTASVDAIAIPLDNQRRFSAKVGTPSGNALAIRLSHPQRGVHYYLRRQK